MDKDFQTSFIPKKALSEERTVRQQPVSLVIFFATLLFFASLAAAGGVYFYKLSLVKKISSSAASLEKAKGAFEPKLIEDLQTLDRRLTAAQEILNNHIITSPIFASLSGLTLKSIQFTKFSYGFTAASGGQAIKVSMSGRARDYTSVALQSDMFGGNKYFKDPVFSNLQLDEKTGNVGFELEFMVDPSFVNFAQTVMSQAAAAAPESTDIDNEGASDVNESALPENLISN